MRTSIKRGLAALTAVAAAGVGLVAASAPASAFDAGWLAEIRNAALVADRTQGTNNHPVEVVAPAACDALATRHVLKVMSVVPANPADQTEADKWAGDNLYAPTGVNLPGPLTIFASSTWQQKADTEGQAIVAGKYNLELRCQDNLGTKIYEQWHGSVTFDSPTHWSADAIGDPTTTTASVSPSGATAGDAVSYSANVTKTGASALTGNVEFAVDGTVVGTAPVDATGAASLAGTAPAKGNHTLTAKYLFDGKTPARRVRSHSRRLAFFRRPPQRLQWMSSPGRPTRTSR